MSVASSVLLIAGSPSGSSRSAALLDSVSLRLARSDGLKDERLNIRELPAQALLLAEWGDPEIVKALAQVQRAQPSSWPRRCTRRLTVACSRCSWIDCRKPR